MEQPLSEEPPTAHASAGTGCAVPRLAAVPGSGQARVPLLLIADPDDRHGKELLLALTERGVQAIICTNGAEALLRIGGMRPDAILISADLPVVDPVDLIGAVRRTVSAPIIIGAGTEDGPQVVRALAAGATACVARPYRLPELLPLIHGVSSEELPGGATGPGETESPVLRCGLIELDAQAHVVRIQREPVHMPLREFQLLHYLLLNADRVVSRTQLQHDVWQSDTTTNTISVHIRRLRERLGDDPENPRLIRTIRGLGYRLVCEK